MIVVSFKIDGDHVGAVADVGPAIGDTPSEWEMLDHIANSFGVAQLNVGQAIRNGIAAAKAKRRGETRTIPNDPLPLANPPPETSAPALRYRMAWELEKFVENAPAGVPAELLNDASGLAQRLRSLP